MKSNFLLIAFVSVIGFFISAQDVKANPDPAYKVDLVSKNATASGRVDLKYEGYQYLRNKTTAMLDNKIASQSVRAKELGLVPQGGYITVTIERDTIDAADTKWFEYVVVKDGKVIQRVMGEKSIPEMPLDADDPWWSLDVFRLDRPIKSGITVYVVDTLQGGRDQFIITRKSLK